MKPKDLKVLSDSLHKTASKEYNERMPRVNSTQNRPTPPPPDTRIDYNPNTKGERNNMKFNIIPDFRILAFFFLGWAIFNVVDGVLANNTINIVKGAWAVLLSVYMFVAAKGFNIQIARYKGTWKE